MKNIVKYKLTFLHKFIGIVLLVLGVLFLLSPTAYKKTLEYEKSGDGLAFLQKGEYVIELYYIAAPRDNAIVFFSDEMLNENNELGKEFLRIDVGTTGGNYRGQLFLDEDVHGLSIKTDMDDEEEYYETLSHYCPNCGAKMDESTMGQVKRRDAVNEEAKP